MDWYPESNDLFSSYQYTVIPIRVTEFQKPQNPRSFFPEMSNSVSRNQDFDNFRDQSEMSPDLPLSISNNIEEIDVFQVGWGNTQNSVQKLKQHALSKTEQDEYFRLEVEYSKNEQKIVQLVSVEASSYRQQGTINQLYSDYSMLQQKQIDEVNVRSCNASISSR